MYNAAKLSELGKYQRNQTKPISAEYRSVEEINDDITRNENEKWKNIIKNTRRNYGMKFHGKEKKVKSVHLRLKISVIILLKKSTIPNEEIFTLDQGDYVHCPVLYDDILIGEVHEAAKRLKEKKSSLSTQLCTNGSSSFLYWADIDYNLR